MRQDSAFVAGFQFFPRQSWLWMLLFVLLLSAASPENPGKRVTLSEAEKFIAPMQKEYRRIHDYTCIFYQQERIDGKLLPQQTIRMKFRKPFSVYMKWIKEPYKGQEIIYVHGWNNGKLRVHPGSFPDITVNLDPNGSLAMKDNRHPVTEAGIGFTIQIVAKDIQTALAHPGDSVQYFDQGQKKVMGREAQCLEAIMPVKSISRYYAHRAVICIDDKWKLPTHVAIYDSTNTLIEEYYYSDIKINPGLTDEDFNPDNPDYNF